ncbi:uncharacterized protein LOC113351530 [Papaver somniferum]|uniref:uncharacterized protein LOC113351530 n=1 Tax=Papaver somniferum TaxID=3469 RepID=UPI000E70280C|nr:uncharacterized protein LOC113351530 [Papaver somniferum]
MAAINEFHSKEKLDWRLNMIFAKLIPKKEDSETVKVFRPLSLISSFYKIISKVLAERIKVVIPSLISNAQGSFIKHKQILDGILIANEYEVVADNRIGGFQVAEGGIMVSHLQFVDDTIIMLNASTVEVRGSLIIFMLFEMMTGLKLNLDKSPMKSIGEDDYIQELAIKLGCKVDSLPITYLGMPIGATKISVAIWDVIIERMKKKLAPWKRKFLNKAGRVTY